MNLYRVVAFVLPSLSLALVVYLYFHNQPPPSRCRFGDEYTVAASKKKQVDAVSVVADRRRAWAFWSDADGLFGRPLTQRGQPAGAQVYIGERCAGGIHATSQAGLGLYLACLRPLARADGDRPGGIIVRHLDDMLGIRAVGSFGNAGSLSQGIDMAVTPRGIWTVWHDASSESASAWQAQLDRGLSVRKLKRLSSQTNLAGAPALFATEQRIWATWTETLLRGGKLAYRVLIDDGTRAPHSVIEQRYRDVFPQLVELDGRPLLAFRDRPTDARAAGLYLVRLAAEGKRIGEPIRVARADGVAPSALSVCGGGLVIASPRTFGPEKFIGVNRITSSLKRPGGEQQFSENSRDFVLAAATCARDRALLLVAERGSSTQSYTNIRSVTHWCQ